MQVSLKDNLLLRMKDQDWQQVLDVNLSAAYKLIRGSIRGMLKKRSGRIINLSSVVAASGNLAKLIIMLLRLA